MLPLAGSVVIHGVALMLVLALTFPHLVVERPTPQRALVLLAPPRMSHSAPLAALHAAPRAPQRMVYSPPRPFHAPVRQLPSPLPEPTVVPAMQIPRVEEIRTFLQPVEVAHLPVVPPPPLRTDNLAPLMGHTSGGNAAGTLRSSGFEQTVGEALPRVRAARLSDAEFEDGTIVPPVGKRSASIAAPTPVTRSVEILSKPRPSYTEEARRLRLEGEVLLTILFAASGQVRVLETVRGLGHGLDENAITAAEAIRFRPAERSGMAADSIALVHIVFQLAF